MPHSLLTEQAHITLKRYSGAGAIGTLLPLWAKFEKFLEALGPLPASILDIPEQALRAYATHLDYQDCHIDDALVALSAVLLVCLRAGYSAKVLRTVVIARIRRPIENRQWDAFRLRTYQPLESSQRARSRRRRAKREALVNDSDHANSLAQ